MRTILVALAVSIEDDSPTPSGATGIDQVQGYMAAHVRDAAVLAVVDREYPENNVEEQLFTDYAPRSRCEP